MEQNIIHQPPISVTDLILLRKAGGRVTVEPSFEINEVDLAHEANPFRAFLFFSRFSGTVDGQEYSFRKCYSRGCQHNLCPQVSQAVMIANRYLQRDYRRLEEVGIAVEKKLFTLESMLAKFEEEKDRFVSPLILEDYIHIAQGGDDVVIDISLEYLPAVENFANYKEKRLFFTANFNVHHLGKTQVCQRCLACCGRDKETEERPTARELANRRAASIYAAFDEAKIKYNPVFFE
ncbi:MAG: hypothetical protein EHM75_01870 [Desulfobacteraceae bacterium]|nr:MAG: hypothetical protein EHM75_01870 [Desulfobacteraceae bacterium]